MGYYTRHELEVKCVNGYDGIDHKGNISELSSYSSCFDDEIKWYSHEEDMRIYSRNHPDTLFILRGEGEESGDLWVEYYKDGKMQRCKAILTYDEFNVDKLE